MIRCSPDLLPLDKRVYDSATCNCRRQLEPFRCWPAHLEKGGLPNDECGFCSDFMASIFSWPSGSVMRVGSMIWKKIASFS